MKAHAASIDDAVTEECAVERRWWYAPALVLIGVLLLTSPPNDRPLHGDAAMYAAIARTVAETGDLTSLSFNGLPYLKKPPLYFWLTAVAFDHIGMRAFTAQLVSGLLGVIDTLVLFAVCRRMGFDERSAFAAALAYVTTPEVVHWTRGVHLESLLTFWLLLGVLASYLSLSRPDAILLLGIAAAGGWMSKGPQALFATAVAPLLWWRDGLLGTRLRSRWTLIAALLFLVVVGPWTWARLSEGVGYAETYFRGQIGRVLTEASDVERTSALGYVVKLLQSYWPWLPFAVAGTVMLVRRWREDAAARTWLLYGALVLVVTSAASVRHPRYLSPLYPMLAVAAGVAVGSLATRYARLLPALTVIGVAAGIVVSVVDNEKSTKESNRMRTEALEIAQALPQGADVWLASDVPQEGMPGISKVLGFYARSPLCACGGRCRPSGAGQELRVVTLAQSAEALARETGASIETRNRTLAVLHLRAGSRDRLRDQVCSLAPVMLPW